MIVNEHLIKIQGTSAIPIERELSLGSDVSIRIDGTVIKELAEDNDDGTKNVTYIVKGILAYELQTDLDH